MLHVGEEAAEVPAKSRGCMGHPCVREGRDPRVVCARDRGIVESVGRGDASGRVLDDGELPRGEAEELLPGQTRVTRRAREGERRSTHDEHGSPRLDHPSTRPKMRRRQAVRSDRGSDVSRIGPSPNVYADRVSVHLFGLTGGIASGKSTVGERLRALGLPVIDADELAREVVAPGSEGLAAVIAAFGSGVLDPSGEALDRKALARVVFTDSDARKKLNAIVHPRIAAKTAARTIQLDAAGEPLACYEAALLVENGIADAFRPLVVCACPEDIQVERVRVRDGATLEEALARIRAQKPLAEKVAEADWVIDTAGSLEDVARRTEEVLGAICGTLGLDAAQYRLGGATGPATGPCRL